MKLFQILYVKMRKAYTYVDSEDLLIDIQYFSNSIQNIK